ncbi:MAG: circularly permuted type 2 ATP-grasp protein, partial [Pseudomonadota bacterium]
MVEQTPFFDEMHGSEGATRAPYAALGSWFNAADPKDLRAKQREAEDLFRLSGITFNVYGR